MPLLARAPGDMRGRGLRQGVPACPRRGGYPRALPGGAAAGRADVGAAVVRDRDSGGADRGGYGVPLPADAGRTGWHPGPVRGGGGGRRVPSAAAGWRDHRNQIHRPSGHRDAASAELAKYAANCFLAMKLSYVNAIAELCERLGADICEVAEALGYDSRIGRGYLSPGPGWGGPCLPKDTQALVQMADAAGLGFGLLRAAIQGNMRQQRRMAEKVRSAVTGKPGGSVSGKRIGLLGLTFKAGTSDLRESPALAVAARLHRAGAELAGCDPAVPPDFDLGAIRVVADAYAAAAGADAIFVLAQWAQFRMLDWMKIAKVMRTPVVVDTRNLLDAEVLRRSGIAYTSLGRGLDARSGMPDSV